MLATIAQTVVKVRSGQWDAMLEFGRSQEQQVSSIPGLISWGWAETADNELTLVVVYKDRKSAESAAPLAAEIFGQMASMVAAPPERRLLDAEWFTT